MITRQEYLKGSSPKNHRAYYSQFVTPEIKGIVEHMVGLKTLLKSTDPHLNDIPLKLWANMFFPYGVNAEMVKAGDYLTLARKVCILKEAAQQLIEENRAKCNMRASCGHLVCLPDVCGEAVKRAALSTVGDG